MCLSLYFCDNWYMWLLDPNAMPVDQDDQDEAFPKISLQELLEGLNLAEEEMVPLEPAEEPEEEVTTNTDGLVWMWATYLAGCGLLCTMRHIRAIKPVSWTNVPSPSTIFLCVNPISCNKILYYTSVTRVLTTAMFWERSKARGNFDLYLNVFKFEKSGHGMNFANSKYDANYIFGCISETP